MGIAVLSEDLAGVDSIPNMKILLGLVLLAAFADAIPKYAEDVLEFDEEFEILEDLTSEEKAKEIERLKRVEDEINDENEKFKEGKAHFGEKLYEFSDLPKKDFEKAKEGLNMPAARSMGMFMPPESERNTPENQAKLDAMYEELVTRRNSAPSSFDSRSLGHVTVAKNQGNCGSCAAFAAGGLHETCMAKAGASLNGLDLSEQYLVDCAYDGRSANGCNGAAPHAYPVWFANDGGSSPHEVNYPYLDNSPRLNCNSASGVAKWNSGARVSDAAYDFSCSQDKLKQLVYEKGAVLVGVYASDDGFMGYDGRGVFDQCTRGSNAQNHAVLVVGYGSDNGQDYWLVKNSWGPNWGDSGFIKIKRGSNMCGIEEVCVVSTCTSSGSADSAPPAPTTTAAPVSMWCDVSGIFGRSDITGNFNLRVSDRSGSGRLIESEVRCQNSQCTPRTPGPSNACMYICGATSC